MDTDIPNKLKFLELVGQLKHIPRTGWVRKNIQNPETIAGHMYRMAMTLFLIDDSDIDKNKCLEMALVHDLGESIIGDITPVCGVSPEEKRRREHAAMEEIAKLVGKSGEHMNALFLEYEEQKTKEAKLVKELDLFDMAVQAYEYEKKYNRFNELQEFIDATTNKISHPLLSKLYSEMLKVRRARSI